MAVPLAPTLTVFISTPKGFTACVTSGCKFTFEAVLGPSKVALPVARGTSDDAEITAKEYEDYGLRVAKHAVRAQERRVFVYKDKFLLWRQVLRCLDWRKKWDLVWTREDNLSKLHKGSSRWHSGEQWERPSPMVFERMRRGYLLGIPGAEEFYAMHRKCFVDKIQPDHAFLATLCTVGMVCDRLERVFVDLDPTLPMWLKTGANSPLANKVYDEVLHQCLFTCNEALKSMVAQLQTKADALGEEKIRHAGWLDQVATSGVAMTKEQVGEIRHAIVKGRPHLEAKMKSETPPVAVATTGSSGASSSGHRYRELPRRSPSRNPPVRSPVVFEEQGVLPPRTPHRGAVKRVFSDRGSDDPFAPTVQRHRDEQARAAPSFRRNPNPNVDARLRDMPYVLA